MNRQREILQYSNVQRHPIYSERQRPAPPIAIMFDNRSGIQSRDFIPSDTPGTDYKQQEPTTLTRTGSCETTCWKAQPSAFTDAAGASPPRWFLKEPQLRRDNGVYLSVFYSVSILYTFSE